MADQPQAQPLLFYTNYFRIERYLTHAYDIVWGQEIPIARAVGLLISLGIEWKTGLLTLPLHVHNPILGMLSYALTFGPMALVWSLVGRPYIEGRPLWHWALMRASYWLVQPREMIGPCLRTTEARTERVFASLWSRKAVTA